MFVFLQSCSSPFAPPAVLQAPGRRVCDPPRLGFLSLGVELCAESSSSLFWLWAGRGSLSGSRMLSLLTSDKHVNMGHDEQLSSMETETRLRRSNPLGEAAENQISADQRVTFTWVQIPKSACGPFKILYKSKTGWVLPLRSTNEPCKYHELLSEVICHESVCQVKHLSWWWRQRKGG